MTLFIAKLSPNTTSRDLQGLFAHYGSVISANVIMDHSTGRSKGYGFVEMPNIPEAIEAIKEVDSTLFQESLISVRKSQPTAFSDPAIENLYQTNYSTRLWSRHEYIRDTTTESKSPQRIASRRNFGYRGSGYKSFDP